MITTWEALANAALLKLGAKRITSFNDDTKGRDLTYDNYPLALDEVLIEHEWYCVIERQTLALLASDNLTTWAYKYQLPSSPWCLRPIELLDVNYVAPDPRDPFQVEGRVLYCDVNGATLRYVGRPSTPAVLEPLLADAVAYRLAHKIAYALTQSRELEAAMEQGYDKALYRAKWANNAIANESTAGESTDTSVIDAGNL